MDNNIDKKMNAAALIPTLETIYVPFSAGTGHPFITTNETDATDQIWVFINEDQCREFAKERFEQNGDPIRLISVKQNATLSFFSNLYFIGIDEIVFVEDKDMTRLPLTELVKRPSFDEVPEESRPLLNPQMQLSGIRLMQEVHRRGDNKPGIREMEEEMIANLMRANFILVTAMLEEGEDPAKHDPKAIPCVQDKEGRKYQPIFSDSAELAKFVGNRKFKAVIKPFADVAAVINSGVDGIVLNPNTSNIIFTTDRLPALLEAFGPAKDNK